MLRGIWALRFLHMVCLRLHTWFACGLYHCGVYSLPASSGWCLMQPSSLNWSCRANEGGPGSLLREKEFASTAENKLLASRSVYASFRLTLLASAVPAKSGERSPNDLTALTTNKCATWVWIEFLDGAHNGWFVWLRGNCFLTVRSSRLLLKMTNSRQFS